VIAFGLGLIMIAAGATSLWVGTTGAALSQQCPNGNCPKK